WTRDRPSQKLCSHPLKSRRCSASTRRPSRGGPRQGSSARSEHSAATVGTVSPRFGSCSAACFPSSGEART
ncbi:MAG: Excisionase/Xis, DNA-binding, partial [uncultured Nocardioidaceae bacterium]